MRPLRVIKSNDRPTGFEPGGDVEAAWRDHRGHLLDIAFRMLGNLSEAEDAVQEAFARLASAERAVIDDVGGWLVVVTSRLCLDRLRAETRHPTASGAALADRAASIPDPADRVTLDDSVRLAMHLVLERLTPAERTTFILHDVFQYTFESISEIVGRTPAACRQLARRARLTVAADGEPSRFQVESAEQRRVTEQFMLACASGDLDGLLAVLDPAVTGHGDGGVGRGRVAEGSASLAPIIMGYLGPRSRTTLVSVPAGDHCGILGLRDGQVVVLLSLGVRDGRVTDVEAIADPSRLAPLAGALGAVPVDRSEGR